MSSAEYAFGASSVVEGVTECVAAQPVLLLAPSDNVLVAVADLPAGLRVRDRDRDIVLIEPIPLGNKLARVPIDVGCKVIKYGAAIGSATRMIPVGALVHLHNLASDYLATPKPERAP